jgi:hypothetical protein
MELPLVQAGRYAETLKDQQSREAEKVKEESRTSPPAQNSTNKLL